MGPMITKTLDSEVPLPTDITMHLDAGHDSGKTRDTLAERSLHGEIAHKGWGAFHALRKTVTPG